ncbi:hypothetical protein ACWED2_04750 [Amycolatopsis sp. NPDC005003]
MPKIQFTTGLVERPDTPAASHCPSDLPAEGLLQSGSAPTDAHLATNALLARVLLEAARRRQDQLPGLTETLQDQVLITCGGTTAAVYGWFDANAWQHGDRPVHELFVNACFSDRPPDISPAENVLVTLLHEAAHVYANANDIQDTSREHRYHNRRFARLAVQLGLVVEPDKRVGHRTPRLSARGQADFGDLVVELGLGLLVQRTPPRGPGDSATARATKYVFASCRCEATRGPVTVRMARGSWRPGAIWCQVCDTALTPSL